MNRDLVEIKDYEGRARGNCVARINYYDKQGLNVGSVPIMEPCTITSQMIWYSAEAHIGSTNWATFEIKHSQTWTLLHRGTIQEVCCRQEVLDYLATEVSA